MKKKHICEAVDFLNEALATDPKAINDLFRVSVSGYRFIPHPTVQVGALVDEFRKYHDPIADPDVSDRLRFLGLLNGMFGIDQNGYGHIYAEYDKYQIVGFFCKDRPYEGMHPNVAEYMEQFPDEEPE